MSHGCVKTTWQEQLLLTQAEVEGATRALDRARIAQQSAVLDAYGAGADVGQISSLLDIDVVTVQNMLSSAARSR